MIENLNINKMFLIQNNNQKLFFKRFTDFIEDIFCA